MAQKPIKLSVDTINDATVAIYDNIRKGDTLLMVIKLFQGSQSLDMTGQQIRIILHKSDGYDVEKILTGLTGTVLTVAFDVQATLAGGDVQGEIQLTDATGTTISNWFVFEVKQSLGSNIVIKSSDKIETLQQVDALIAEYNGNAGQLAIQNALALTNISTLESDITTGNTLDESLKNDISIGTPLDLVLKSDISIGQALDILLKSTIAIGNTTNNTLLTSISNGNEVITNLTNANWNEVWATIQEILSFYIVISQGTIITDENKNYITDENGLIITM